MADTEARWYCVNAQGLPMLCASKEDAEREAARNDKVWPKGAPHRAVQLCDAAERDRLRQLTEMQAANIERQADSIQKLMEQSERRKEYADRLRADVRELVEFIQAAEETAMLDDSVEVTSTTWAHLSNAGALLAKHNPLQALADNAREMGLSYEDGSKT